MPRREWQRYWQFVKGNRRWRKHGLSGGRPLSEERRRSSAAGGESWPGSGHRRVTKGMLTGAGPADNVDYVYEAT
jgi:hypothetical protein